MKNIKNKIAVFRQGYIVRAMMLVLVLAVLGGVLTGCAGAPVQQLTSTAPAAPAEGVDYGMSVDSMSVLVNDIKESKNGLIIRERLVAALNGYHLYYDDQGNPVVEGATTDEDGQINLPDPSKDKTAEYAREAITDGETGTSVSVDQLTFAGVQALVDCFKTTVTVDADRGLLDTVLHWVGIAFGWMIRVLGFGNFMLGTVFFAILVEIVMLPLGIRQQKNSIKQAKLRPKEMAIRNKYKGRTDQATQQKVTQEVQEMYQKEGFNPMSGCLPLLLSLPVIMALYYIVIDPLKYVMGAPGELSTALVSYATASPAAGGLGLSLSSHNGTIEVLSLIKEADIAGLAGFEFFANGQACVDALTPMMEDVPSFSMLGINFGLTPNFGAINTINGFLLLVPVLTFALYFFSSKLNRKLTQMPAAQQDATAGCSNKMMDIMMPAMSAYFTFVVPGAVGLYWGIKSIISMGKQIILSKVMPLPKFTEADYKAAEKEMAGKEKNKPVKSSGKRNPNVRSLHYIDEDEEDYGAPAPQKGKKWEEDPAEDAPAEEKVADNAYGDGVTLKEDRPVGEEKKSIFKKKNAPVDDQKNEKMDGQTSEETSAQANEDSDEA